jgi:hypothetical protein
LAAVFLEIEFVAYGIRKHGFEDETFFQFYEFISERSGYLCCLIRVYPQLLRENICID